uniref:Uncharacterized protein n=1 Tax=Panagrolaimus davidi TaxID=227884 RepID=A0A914Q170_9BILA
MPPLCGKCSLAAYDELNRQLTELEMEGNAYEETLHCLQESASTSPYNSESNQTVINECDEEIEKLENELKLLEFEETQLQWDIDDVTKKESESSKEYDELFRGWKAGQRSLISRNELLHSLNNQNLYYLSQNERLKSPELLKAIAGTFKKPVFDPCDKLVFN